MGVAVLHNHSLLVRGQAIDDEMNRLIALMYHFFEELYEQLGSHRTLVGLKPTGAFPIDNDRLHVICKAHPCEAVIPPKCIGLRSRFRRSWPTAVSG